MRAAQECRYDLRREFQPLERRVTLHRLGFLGAELGIAKQATLGDAGGDRSPLCAAQHCGHFLDLPRDDYEPARNALAGLGMGGQLRSNTPLRKESPDLPGNSSGTGAE
jgi:hypothetical protein